MSSKSLFTDAIQVPPDPIFALTAEYLQDSFVGKVNLGQGTYRDERGNPWVLPSVQKAREELLHDGLNHEYLPILGLEDLRLEACKLALGDELFTRFRSQVITYLQKNHSLCVGLHRHQANEEILLACKLPKYVRHRGSTSRRAIT